MKLVALISGRGSNLRSLFEAIEAGRCRASVAAVIADKDAPGLSLAQERGVPTRVVKPKDYANRAAWDRALAEVCAEYAPELVVLAGFMRIVGEAMVERFAWRIVNVHPALLPSFPGVDGPAQAIAAGVRLAGCTVHLVDRGVDTGPILAQAAVPVLPGDDAASLHARIQVQEHHLLPAVVDAVARGTLTLGQRPAYAADAPFPPSALRAPAL